MNDAAKTALQERGDCFVRNMTVLEIADIVSSLGLDPRLVRISGDIMYVSEDRLAGGQSVTLR
jgi:hypothetical protein